MAPYATKRLRSRAGIVYDILKTVKEEVEAPPTRIMYGARLPYDRLQEILELLVRKGLLRVRKDKDRTFYVITSRGMEALEELERAKRLLEGLGIRF